MCILEHHENKYPALVGQLTFSLDQTHCAHLRPSANQNVLNIENPCLQRADYCEHCPSCRSSGPRNSWCRKGDAIPSCPKEHAYQDVRDRS